ncbi:MAG: hypothetical protein HYZ84_05605, partial [Candidatus Omnitrophica bacterium]|nr:hypothetical protein [Candidatus Omnitrophota bacterium]
LHRVSASSKSELRLPARQREKKLRQETARFTEYYRLEPSQLEQLGASIRKFMEKVPGEETMLRNYQGLPDFEKWVGKEFLKVNIGGTNLEIARQRLKQNGKLETLAIKKYRFSVADKSGTSEKLFNLIAAKIGQVVKNDKAYPVELIWSFPAKLNSLRRGKILTWNKGWNVPDAIGQNPVTLLESALKRKGLDKVRVRALQNDTTWALIQGYLQNPDTFVGFVASTGFNIAYFEKKSVTNPNARSDGYEAVNTEIGAALDGVAESLTTTIDRKVDTASTNPKVHILEKLIAAKYLAEQLRIQIRDWMNDGIIFNGQKIPPVFNRRDALKPELLSLILADKTAGLKRIKAFLETKGIQSTPAERQAIQKITKVVSRRSATILANTLAEVAQKASPEQVAQAFAGDSSLRDSMPGYAQILSYAFGTATQDDSFPYQFFSTRLQSPAQKPAAAALSELRTVQINVAGNGLAVKGEHLSRTFTFELGDSSHTLIPPGQIETKIKDVFKDRKPVDWGVPDEKSGMAFYLILDDESLVTVFSDGKVLTMNDFDRQVRSQWRQQDWHSGLLAATKTPPPLSGLGLAYYSALTAEIKRQAPDNADARQIIARHVVQHVKTLPEIEKIAGQSLLLIMLLAGWVAKSPNLLLDGKNRPLLPPALQSAEDAFEYAIKWYETVLRKGGQDSLDVTLPSKIRL